MRSVTLASPVRIPHMPMRESLKQRKPFKDAKTKRVQINEETVKNEQISKGVELRGKMKKIKENDLMDENVTFELERLYDPYNLDHIPEEERLDLFPKRDLVFTKQYKAVVKILGAKPQRIRVLFPPPMDTMAKRRRGEYIEDTSHPPKPLYTTALKPLKYATICAKDVVISENKTDKLLDSLKYKSWISKQKEERKNLDSIGLNREYLQRKPMKTILEKRVLEQLISTKSCDEDEKVECPRETSTSTLATGVNTPIPHINVPAPYVLEFIEEHLYQNKIRLIDLFAQFNKEGTWKLTHNQFREGINKLNIGLSPQAVQDLIVALDADFNNEIDFKELSTGLNAWRKQKMQQKRRNIEEDRKDTSNMSLPISLTSIRPKSWPNKNSETSLCGSLNLMIHSKESVDTDSRWQPDEKSNVDMNTTAAEVQDNSLKYGGYVNSRQRKIWSHNTSLDEVNNISQLQVSGEADAIQAKSFEEGNAVRHKHELRKRHTIGEIELQKIQSLSACSLDIPTCDLGATRQVYSSEEDEVDARKRVMHTNNKFNVLPEIIKTGDDRIDAHCARTTLTPDLADMIQVFRDDRLKEYYEILDICEQSNKVLSADLLKKALMYPGDRTYAEINGHIRQPGLSDLPPNFSSKKSDEHENDLDDYGGILGDVRLKKGRQYINMVYPFSNMTSPRKHKQILSTGKALVSRKVDCWMTFEEYERLTGCMAIQYHKRNKTHKYNPFWPGHMLDTLCVYMPPFDQPPHHQSGSKALFQEIPPFKSSYPEYERSVGVWPLGEEGCVQQGHIHKGQVQNWSIQ